MIKSPPCCARPNRPVLRKYSTRPVECGALLFWLVLWHADQARRWACGIVLEDLARASWSVPHRQSFRLHTTQDRSHYNGFHRVPGSQVGKLDGWCTLFKTSCTRSRCSWVIIYYTRNDDAYFSTATGLLLIPAFGLMYDGSACHCVNFVEIMTILWGMNIDWYRSFCFYLFLFLGKLP